MRSIITIVFFVLTSTHKQILTKAHYYLNIFTVYLKTCGCGYFLEPHTRMLVTSLACRVITKSRGWVFFLATMRVSLGYFHGKREEIDPKVLPSCPIPNRQKKTLSVEKWLYFKTKVKLTLISLTKII